MKYAYCMLLAEVLFVVLSVICGMLFAKTCFCKTVKCHITTRINYFPQCIKHKVTLCHVALFKMN